MVRYVAAILIIVHGLIHLPAFTKAFGISKGRTIAGDVSKPAGICWLISATLFVITGVLIMRQNSWWHVGLFAVLLSQAVIVSMWHEAKAGTIANAILLCAAALNFMAWQFTMQGRKEATALLSAHHASRYPISAQAAQLPAPVKKWLARSGALTHATIYNVRLKQKGTLRMSDNSKWLPMTAEQYFNTDEPAFIWLARIRYGGLTHIAGKDTYRNGNGRMIIKAASVLPIADATGAETDQGTMLRYLAEIQWFPTAALSPYITWKAIDTLAAEASMNYMGMNETGIFHFNIEGDITAFEAKRYMERNGHYSLETWYVPVTAYATFDGVRVPSKGTAIWRLKTGDFNWFNWEITSIAYNNTEVY